MQRKQEGKQRMFIDIGMFVCLLFLMAYQVTGELLHEWLGILMTVLVILHQVLNRKWYGTLFKGRYTAYRILSVSINVLLILSFLMTALCGMSMSAHAVPFLYGILRVSFARAMHLSLSHWSFVLMGLHLGLHLPMILSKLKPDRQKEKIFAIALCLIAVFGFYLSVRNKVFDYLFFQAVFAFLDYGKAAVLVFCENLMMLLSWVYLGWKLVLFSQRKKEK